MVFLDFGEPDLSNFEMLDTSISVINKAMKPSNCSADVGIKYMVLKAAYTLVTVMFELLENFVSII